MTLGVRAMVHDAKNGNVLLVRHTYIDGWHLPGGGVESSETATEALARELQEEAGLVPANQPQLLSVHFNKRASRRDHILVYLVTEYAATGEFKPTREIAAAEFFPLSELPEALHPTSRQRIAEVFEHRAISPYW